MTHWSWDNYEWDGTVLKIIKPYSCYNCYSFIRATEDLASQKLLRKKGCQTKKDRVPTAEERAVYWEQRCEEKDNLAYEQGRKDLARWIIERIEADDFYNGENEVGICIDREHWQALKEKLGL
ncbi:hypothetical protein LCGC14_0902500 [marine sediment metagenome]|uniref:Uncharacterized protein n=1 Tax=marine sediment metagenome TaxID=412755 RepID=A0A0F9RF34_9ZZZZ